MLTHNIANCLGLSRVEDRLAEFTESNTISFADYKSFFQRELITRFTNVDEVNANVDLNKVDQVCWYVCGMTYAHRDDPILVDEDLYKLWRIFNFLAERDETGCIRVPVLMDHEEVAFTLQRFHAASGSEFNTQEFEEMAQELPQFNSAQFVNLFERHHCKGLDRVTISGAIRELFDELLVEVLKKVSDAPERWYRTPCCCLSHVDKLDFHMYMKICGSFHQIHLSLFMYKFPSLYKEY